MIDLVGKLNERWAKATEPWKARGNYPSSLAHPCSRKLWNDRDHGDKALPFKWEMRRVMEEGQHHEALLIKQLQESGVMVQQQQTRFEDKDHAIYGKIDGMVQVDGKLWPVEIKSMSPFMFDMVETLEDLLSSEWHYLRGYAYQLFLYLYLTNCELGVMLLKNKATGEVRQIEFSLTANNDQGLRIVESLLLRADLINAAVASGEQPAGIEYEKKVCGDCGYRVECWGDEEAFTAPPLVVDEGELLSVLRRRDELQQASKDYDKEDKRAKELIKALNVERGECGEYAFEVKESIFRVEAKEARMQVTVTVKIKRKA